MSWHKYKILAHLESVKRLQSGEWVTPLYAALQLNLSCNQNCQSCAFSEDNKSHFTASREDAFKIVDRLIDYGIKNIELAGGGEPTILPYFTDLVNHIIERGGNYALITNGVALDDKMIELVAKTAIYCRVSLETGDKELYLRYKRVSSWHFDKVIENIIKLNAVKDKKAEISLKFDVDKNLYSDNHLKKSFEIARNLNVSLAAFKSMTGETELDEFSKMELSEQLTELIKDNSSDTKFINSICYEKWQGKCWLSPLHCVVDCYGNVYICCYYYRKDAHDQKEHTVGNILDKTFKELWETKEHWQKIGNINPQNCAKFDCKYFSHHKIVNEVLKIEGGLGII